MRSAFAVALAACVLLFAGCSSSLKVYRVDDAHPGNSPGSIPYALPKKTLLIAASYVLTACKTEIDKDTQKPALRLDAEVTANVVATNEVDSEERYLIPYAEIRSWTKDTNITVESYPNQTLKSLNGSITDQAGAVLTATAGAFIKFAGLALTGAAVKKAEDEMCTEEARNALSDLAGLKAALEATSPKPTDAEAARITKKIATLVADRLTTKVSLSWTPTLDGFPPSTNAVTKVVRSGVPLGKWLTPAGRAHLAEKMRDSNDLHVELAVPQSARAAAKNALKGSIDGIVVADPAVGTIRICKAACPGVGADGAVVDNVLQVVSAAFPQLGRRIVLPLTNYFLQSSQLDLAVSEDGVITKLGIKSTSSAATTITGLGGNFEAAKAAIEAHEKAKAAAQTAAQTKARDENKVLADCLEAQDKIIAKGGIPIGKCQ